MGDALSTRARGPWDVNEQAPEMPRVDLGCIRLPVSQGMELRIEVDRTTVAPSAVEVVVGEASMQLSAFAAPRSTGIWDDVRAQLRSSLADQGATVDDVVGEHGPEVVARLGGRTLRFVGVDGPRWFLRAVLHASAADAGPAAEAMREVLRGCIVVRDEVPMAPGDLLPFDVAGLTAAAQAADDDGDPA